MCPQSRPPLPVIAAVLLWGSLASAGWAQPGDEGSREEEPPPSRHRLDWGGFAVAGAAAGGDDEFDADALSAQIQMGLDWSVGQHFGAHVHALARTDDGDTTDKGKVGLVEAYLEAKASLPVGRLRARGGAFFLPGSFENVDALWENPYTISSSALNTWIGEELRPVGLDVAYFVSGLTVGATLFEGNETLGALPTFRGWSLHDRWTLLGQRLRVDELDDTSVSAENDDRLGRSVRAGWSGRHFSAQYTWLDNEADGLRYGRLLNWGTELNVLGVGWSFGEWTLAAESGWGPTWFDVLERIAGGSEPSSAAYPVEPHDHAAHDQAQHVTLHIDATYLLVSRRLPSGRVSFRFDTYDDGADVDEAYTVAYTRDLKHRLRWASEVLVAGSETRVQMQLRCGISKP